MKEQTDVQKGVPGLVSYRPFLIGACLLLLLFPGTPPLQAGPPALPWSQMQPAAPLAATYNGPARLVALLEQGRVEPLALAVGDFNRDGIGDLVAGYTSAEGALLVLHQGVPRLPGAASDQAQPFAAPGRVVALPTAPELLATGDFDNDGWLDIVASGRGQAALTLLPGAGADRFAATRQIALPGTVTSMLAADVNRPDGQTDLLVGMVQGDTPRLLVFEAPQGALSIAASAAEAIDLPAPAVALASGQLLAAPGESARDVAIAAGREIMILHGRDRKLSQDSSQRAQVAAPQLSRFYAGLQPAALAVGNFTGSPRQDVAVLARDGRLAVLEQPTGTLHTSRIDQVPAGTNAPLHLLPVRVSGHSHDDLLITAPGSALVVHASSTTQPVVQPLALTSATPAAVLSRSLSRDALSDLVVLDSQHPTPQTWLSQASSSLVVNTVEDSDDGSCSRLHCTLREAITAANDSSGPDVIEFAIDLEDMEEPGDTAVIELTSVLPPIVEPVTIDGTSQPDYQDRPLIELDGSNLDTGLLEEPQPRNGLVIQAASSTIQGLAINGFPGNGLLIEGAETVIRGNVIGLTEQGLTQQANEDNGIFVENAPGTRIGGTTPAERNIISGNLSWGIRLSEQGTAETVIQGNYIGLNRFARSTEQRIDPDVGNLGGGILVEDAPDTLIGGTEAGSGNLIAANTNSGILVSRSGATGTTIQGNLIGTDRDGLVAYGNAGSGIRIDTAAGTLVGGTSTAARNVVAGNSGSGIVLAASSTSDVLMQGNYIGLDGNGSASLGNQGTGVRVDGSVNNTIGGTIPEARNIIASNNGSGISILNSNATGNRIQGNYIGTDHSGNIALGNTGQGVNIESPANLVGGNDPGAGNLIAGNGGNGIRLVSANADGNRVQGNFIGTNASGEMALGNDNDGILISEATRNQIGGTTPTERNIVAGNRRHGITIQGETASGNRVQGNFVGTSASGEATLGNSANGILLISSNNSIIGGQDEAAANLIVGSGSDAVQVSQAQAEILQNTLRDNTTGIRMQGGNLTVAGNTIVGNGLVFGMSSGHILAYLNVISTYDTALSRNGGTFQGNYNWWGRSTGSAPAGLPLETWRHRLYEQPAAWASGEGQVTLGDATLSGGTGMAAIVRYPRDAFDLPATDGMPLSGILCSDPYTFFTIDGGGTWRLVLPVDESSVCAEALAEQQVYRVVDPFPCGNLLGTTDCWEGLPPEDKPTIQVESTGQNLIIAGMLADELEAAVYAAGPINPPTINWLLVGGGVLVALLLLVAVVVLWRGSRLPPDEAAG